MLVDTRTSQRLSCQYFVTILFAMPIFNGQKKSGSDRDARRFPGAGPGGGGGSPEKKAGATPPLPPPPDTNHPRLAPAGGSAVPTRQELVFHCQLAHGSPTKDIKDFSNVRELYSRIAEAFNISTDQVWTLSVLLPWRYKYPCTCLNNRDILYHV